MASGRGLRARVVVNLAAAASISTALLALLALVVLRDAVGTLAHREAARIATVSAAALDACPSVACRERFLVEARRSGVELRLIGRDAPGVERLLVGRAAATESDVEATISREELERIWTVATGRVTLLLLLNVLILLVVGGLLFERALVRRVLRVEEGLSEIEERGLDASLVKLGGGDEIGRLGGTVRRITDRLKEDREKTLQQVRDLEAANRALRETREDLARAEKLATVGRLAAGVAHEIGNPIAAIIGYIDILRLKRDAPMGEYLERIERETKRVDRIVRDLLDFARPRPMSITSVGLSGAVEAATRLVRTQPRWRRMAIEARVAADVPKVLAQEHYVVQILVNLLINAADACNGEGRVVVEARAVADGVEVTVADDGPGVPPEAREKLFEPFFSTKAAGEGTGLGLAICSRLMEAFGGAILLAPGVDKGATFVLRFRTQAA